MPDICRIGQDLVDLAAAEAAAADCAAGRSLAGGYADIILQQLERDRADATQGDVAVEYAPHDRAMLLDNRQTSSVRAVTDRRDAAHPHPRAFEAAILSRMRSAVTSRSNWANESSMLSVRRPMLVVALNDWVTETKLTSALSNASTNLEKSSSERVSRSTLQTTTMSILFAAISASSRVRPERSSVPPEIPPSSYSSVIRCQPSLA
jgi:hypothetical protein